MFFLFFLFFENTACKGLILGVFETEYVFVLINRCNKFTFVYVKVTLFITTYYYNTMKTPGGKYSKANLRKIIFDKVPHMIKKDIDGL